MGSASTWKPQVFYDKIIFRSYDNGVALKCCRIPHSLFRYAYLESAHKITPYKFYEIRTNFSICS